MESLIIVYNTKVIGMIGAIGINSGVIMLFLFLLQISKGLHPCRVAFGYPAFACNDAVGGSVVIITYHCKISRQSSFVLPFVNRSNDDK